MASDDQARVALLCDIVASRRVPDRPGLHRTIETVLDRVNRAHPVIDPAVITLGDEFQGVYATLGDALTASFHIRAGLFPHDVRFGLGRGDVQTLDERRGIHDGSAYWSARDAIEVAKELAGTPALRLTRAAFRSDVDPAGLVGAVNAALLSLDQLVGTMSEVSRRILHGRLAGASQRELAEQEGITPSAVSQRVIKDGVTVATETMRMLGGLP
jgi:hypothetical protein